MTHDPRTTREIYESLRNSLTGKITKLTNFTDRSFNAIWTDAIAEEFRKIEVAATVSELSGFIEYSGGPVTQEELEELGYGDVDAEEVNELMDDNYLDELVKIVGVQRLDGSRATGEVTFTTQSDTTQIPEGTVVTTEPESDGSTIKFETTEYAETPDGSDNGVTSEEATSVTVPIRATNIGTESNVPAEKIIRVENPPVGVTGVINNKSTDGGDDAETNDELRSRAQAAVEGASEGGTPAGIKTYIRQNVDGVREGDVLVDEFYNEQPPFVDVIVNGGTDSEVSTAIDNSRPAGIRHTLVRPQIIQVDLDTTLTGTDIDTSEKEGSVTTSVENWLLTLGINESLYKDELIRQIMISDNNIINIERLGANIGRVTNERYIFSQDVDSALAADGGNITDETEQANNNVVDDITLLPESPATGDAYYIGYDTPFSGFDIDISTSGQGDWDIVWEYYNGNNWVGLNASDGTNDFRDGAVSTISWNVPSDWVKFDNNGTRKYFVRGRLDSFTSISRQPLGEQIRITGGSYRLDYTFEDTNGSVTIRDSNDFEYTEGTDYDIIDQTGDSWPETVVWYADSNIPEHEQAFTVSYDVTTESTAFEDYYRISLIRDEIFTFNLGQKDIYDYTSGKTKYKLSTVPFVGTTSVTDSSGDTYSEGNQYNLIDNTGNGYEQTIEWTSTDRPDNDEQFTVTYDQRVYHLDYEVTETTSGQIRDKTGDTYEQDVDYDIVDYTEDREKDSIEWLSNPSTLKNGEEFFITYLTEGDVAADSREKIDPGSINFTVE